MYYSAASQTFYAANCDEDSYGGANITYGLAANPCRECPIGLVAQTMYPTSAAHYTMDTSVTPNRGGFTGPRACVTQAGFGYNGKVSTRCPVGTWNPAGSLTPCTQCGFCLSTVNDPANQVDASNCTLAAGCGYHSGAIVPCPVGEFVCFCKAAIEMTDDRLQIAGKFSLGLVDLDMFYLTSQKA